MGIKNAEFEADFESVEKRPLRQKFSAKTWQKNGVFDFYYCVQKVSAYNFFWVNFFSFFFNGFELSVSFVFNDTFIKLLQTFFFNFIKTFC